MNLKLQLHHHLLLFFILFALSPACGQNVADKHIHRQTYTDTLYITGNVVVSPGDSMIIPPGTMVLFTAHFHIEVQGKLIAQGSSDKPICFTTADTTGFTNQTNQRGAWGGIEFINTSRDNDSSIFTHCHFSYAKAMGDTISKYGSVFNIRNFNKIRIQDCDFRHTFAWHWGGAIYGEYANILIKNSFFGHNACGQVGLPYGYGGAVYFRHSSPEILNCSFVQNSSTGMGGGACFEYADVSLEANLFKGNHSALGGALGYVRSEPTQAIVNNVFIENNAVFFGEAIACLNSSPTFLHNTLVDNYNDSYGGVFYCNESSSPVVVNSILYNTVDSDRGIEVYMWDNLSKPQFINCNLLGGKEAFGGTGAADYDEPYTGNIDEDPQLIHTETYYCLLTENSPCIDAGTAQFDIQGYPAFDFRGFPRITGSAPDIGAFEYKSDLGFNNPKHYSQLLCYPNPFNSHLKISIPDHEEETSLQIYDVNGRLIFAKKIPATVHDFIWDGRDINGHLVKRGIYIVKSYSMQQERSTTILRGL